MLMLLLLLHLLLHVAQMAHRVVVDQEDALLGEGLAADVALVGAARIRVLVHLAATTAGTPLHQGGRLQIPLWVFFGLGI